MSDDSLSKIVDSLVEERKSERKFKLLSRVFFVILLLIIFYLSLSKSMDNNIYQSEHTAVIKLDGVIASNGTINTETTLELISKPNPHHDKYLVSFVLFAYECIGIRNQHPDKSTILR